MIRTSHQGAARFFVQLGGPRQINPARDTQSTTPFQRERRCQHITSVVLCVVLQILCRGCLENLHSSNFSE